MAHINESSAKQIKEICHRYDDENTPLMMILSDIQKEYGYIPLEIIYSSCITNVIYNIIQM